ncbi:MAG TPA: 2-hydroxymuconate tautomerase [Acidimicrobiales bacterium]|jgi:4-oxalocrotonate tautomerase|nr:2-hydroxymuconate tautomerase [Acidimicrobiales bacterium]
MQGCPVPIVHIDLLEGRSTEKIETMIAAVSHAIADSLETPIDGVRVIVREMDDHHYGIGGKARSVIRAETEPAPGANGSG